MLLGLLSFFITTILVIATLLRIYYPPLWRDVYTIFVNISLLRAVKKAFASKEFIIDQFERQVLIKPQHPFIIFKDEIFTYSAVNQQANRVAFSLQKLGIGPGDTIALVMSNEPAFLWIYLGVQKLGARIALVNHYLVCDALRHSITSCSPKLVIVGQGFDDKLPDRVYNLKPQLEVPVYAYRPEPKNQSNFPSFSDLMSQVSDGQFPSTFRSELKLSDPCTFIFTSGTTGLPKPAIISHKKTILCSHSYSPVGFSSKEIMYLTLPLYHASALNLAFLNVINVGATLVLRDKFSSSQFWADCVQHNVTCFQYIGEMLRYLVNSPEKPEEQQHKVWAAIGNGLRPDIWVRVKSRFQIDQIFEFYGSTELPATVANLFNVAGSVGRLSPLLSKLTKLILVKVDLENGEPFRNASGRCELIQPGEFGLLLAQLTEKVTFDGYLGPASDTSSRIIKDVLEVGDFYVNTNDVFTMDAEYNLFFKDRIGDSFRWLGENVSTAELSNLMNTATFVQDTNVFGVEVPGYEGKTGMAAINLKEGEELDDEKVHELGSLCRQKLPGYARPRFLRFQRQMSLTTTFKQQKTELIKEGFDPQNVDEPLYYLDRSSDAFRRLDDKTYKDILKGHITL
ncbi:unnamed protein product [Candidula unifasciata]|uniref:Long-chain-fatty-acid--CoA ligase n=1 Tax=Candidula unifasciata TaxID=100452 RepID=A0A8S3Z7X7_9EUPU|nr:unnamed protein product [Candidula unifasciata]